MAKLGAFPFAYPNVPFIAPPWIACDKECFQVLEIELPELVSATFSPERVPTGWKPLAGEQASADFLSSIEMHAP